MIDIKIPKLAKGGVISPPIESAGVSPDEYIYGLFMTQKEMLEKIEHQKKVIDRLSRKIQNKNKKYNKLFNRNGELNDTITFYARSEYSGKQYHCVIHCSRKTFSTDLENRTTRSILRGGFSSYELKDFYELKDVVRCLRHKGFTEIDYFEDKG